MDVDVETIARRQTLETLPRTRQMFESARISLDGFHLPIAWQGEDTAFAASQQSQEHLLALASGLGMSYATATLAPDTARPFPEEFEQHVTRISQIAEALAGAELSLGLTFTAAPSARNADANEFIADVEKFLALLNSINSPNVGLIVDTVNWVVGGGTPEQLKSIPAEKIIAARFASLPEGMSASEATPNDRTLPHSNGVVDNGKYLAPLTEINYEGPVLAYPKDEIGKRSSDSVVRAARESLDQLWIDAGLSEAPPAPEPTEEESGEEVDAGQAQG